MTGSWRRKLRVLAVFAASAAVVAHADALPPNVAAQFEQGRRHLYGMDAREDPLKALELFRRAAEAGHAEAQYHLGWLCWSGEIPPFGFALDDAYLRAAVQCQPEGKRWLEKAAAQGEWHAQELLVQIAEEEGLPKEPIFFCFPSADPQADLWLAAAAEAGNRDAQAEQTARENNPPTGSRSMLNHDYYVEHMTRARAEQNLQFVGQIKRDARAGMKSIVAALRRGESPSALLSERTIPWLRRAAKAGNAAARQQWQELTRATKGMPRDERRGVQWVEAAAMRGDARAQYDLGYLYASGRCVSPDHARAYYLFDQARRGLPSVERQQAETALAGLTVSHEPDELAKIQNRARASRNTPTNRVRSGAVQSTYPTRDGALRAACDSTANSEWSGPWSVGGVKAHIGVLWSEGQRSACMGYAIEAPAGYRIFASTYVPAGFSARYNEYVPPAVLDRVPVVLYDHVLFFVGIGHMGLGGGGGDGTEIQIWSARPNDLSLLFGHTPVSFTNINAYLDLSEGSVPEDVDCTDSADGLLIEGDRLRVRACLDGKVQRRKTYRFDGERFVEQ